jgi:outer membrane lipoprotein-sorting protein
MKRLMALALGIVLAAPAFASDEEKKAGGDLTDAVEILKKMDAAAKAVNSVSYDVEFDATGDATKFVPTGKGSVLMSGWSGRLPEKFRIEVEAKKSGAEETRKLTGGSDGENYFLIDHAAKTAYEDIDPNVMGAGGQLLFAAMMIEFVHETPFTDEINGKNQELKGSEKIGDVDCYVVYLEYATAPQKATWYIGKQDFLPRRRIDHFDRQDMGKGDVRKTITKLVVDPKPEEDAFKLKLPEGFKKSDDFAP